MVIGFIAMALIVTGALIAESIYNNRIPLYGVSCFLFPALYIVSPFIRRIVYFPYIIYSSRS